MAEITIVEESITHYLPEYAHISSAFSIAHILQIRVVNGGLGGILLDEVAVSPTIIKDYDTVENPSCWAAQWDISKWGRLTAYSDHHRVGGCLLAYNTEGVEILEGRTDLTALWDIRVAPDFRRRGIATKLFTAAVIWAQQRSCTGMKIETQNNNVTACRFYQAQGCILQRITRFAYPMFPDETQLIWYLPL